MAGKTRWTCWWTQAAIVLVASSSVLSHVGEASNTDPLQLRAFVDAVWRNPPSHIDMHMKIRVVRNGEVEYHLQRFRSDGESRRVDTVKQSEDQWEETQHFKESRITGRITDAGSLTEITVNYPNKTFTADTTRNKSAQVDPRFQMMASLEVDLQTTIRDLTGRRTEGEVRIEQDAEKTTDFVTGAQTLVPSVTRDTLGNHTVLRFDFVLPEESEPLYTVYCDGENVRRPLLQIVRDSAGRTIRRTEQSGYEDDGFPRYWKETKTQADGSEDIEERIVTQLDLSTKPAEEIFQYHVPQGFLDAYITKGKVVYTLSEGQNHDAQEQPRGAASNPQFQRTIWLLNLCILIGMGISFVSRILYRYWKARKPASH